MRKIIIGVMGPGEKATLIDIENAYQLGKRIAEQGWVLLTGGRNVGVMEAAVQGAKQNNGLTIGILPGKNSQGVSEALDIVIFTDMNNARNNINVLSSDVVVACGMGLGTASEVALALKSQKPVILLTDSQSQAFFQKMAPEVCLADDVEITLTMIKNILENSV
ncbi:MAG: TIGR00725 family protein [Calothrix sp. C42_A2020_038]|nr:TIGR00725 family protein [Calothrix sp. C42_A2020_038]